MATLQSIAAMAEQLYQAGVDVPFLSVLAPYPGTPAYSRLVEEGRILSGRGWEFLETLGEVYGYDDQARELGLSASSRFGAKSSKPVMRLVAKLRERRRMRRS